VRLPELSVKTFSGDPMDWLEFVESFGLTVDENKDLDERSKLIYLKRYLVGEPLKMVTGLSSSEGGNYKRALDCLKERYGRHEVLKEILVGQLYRLDRCRGEDLAAARHLLDEVNVGVGQLSSIGTDVNVELGVALLTIIRDKMPPSWQLEWARRCEEAKTPEERNFSALLSFMHRELRVREQFARTKASAKKQGVEVTHKQERCEPDESTAQALKAGVTRKRVKGGFSKGKETFRCTFCDGPHPPCRCDCSALSAQQRFNRVKDAKACFVCGVVGHMRFDCQWNVKCRHCGGRHIDPLCQTKGKQGGSCDQLTCMEDNGSTTRSQAQGSKSDTSQGGGEIKAHMKTCPQSQDSALMRTALVAVNGRVVTVMMADTGCSKTFIRSDVAAKASAEVLRTETLKIESFGGKTEIRKCDVVSVELRGLLTKDSIEVEAVCVPELGSVQRKISPTVLSEVHVKGMSPLADHYGSVKETDDLGILLGEDLYDTALPGPTKILDGGLKCTWSVFGWILHGGFGTPARRNVKMY
jgi:hypothetical protein